MADAGFNPFSGIDANMPSAPSGGSGWAQQLFANNPVSTSRYNFTPLNYQAPSFSSGPSLASSLIPSNAGSSSSNGGNSGGFLSGIGNFFSGLGNDIYNGYEHLKGAFEGAFNPALQQNADLAKTLGPLSPNNPNVIFDGHGLRYKDATTPNFLDQIGNIAKGTWNGLINPTQTQQSFNQNLSTTTKDSPGTGLGSFALQVATDPLTYVPVGTVARATGVTPALKAGFNFLKNTPVLDNKVVNGVADFLGNKFVPNYGASKDLVNILQNRSAEHSTNQFNILDEVKNLSTNHGMTDAELNDIGHAIENPTNVRTAGQQSFIPKFEQLRDNGISSSTGTNALLNTQLNGKALLDNPLPNYFKHMYRNIPDDLKGVFPKSGIGQAGLSPFGEWSKPRTYDTLQDAMNAGLKPETNPFAVLGEHLNQTSRAVTNANAITDVLNTPGLTFDKAAVDNVQKLVKTGQMTADQAAQALGMSLDELKQGFVESSVPQLRGAYIRPADEQALKTFLNPGEQSSLYDRALGQWKKLSTYNSLVHGHNILYNGMWLGGAKPSYVLDAFKNIKNGTNDPWFQDALRNGAVSADRGSFMSNLKSAYQNTNNPIREKLNYALHGALWDLDRAMRTAIFRDAIENGATGTEAATKANKFLTNYNNLTPFEEKVMTRIFPFYRWMKGNIPLQVEQWVNNTPKQMLYEHAKNSINQAITGQDMGPDGKIDTGIVLPDGSHVKIDPYSPADEPVKALNDGIVPFLFGKQNPILKELETELTNHAYYPESMFAPNGKESMANSLIRNPGAPSSDNVRSTISHIVNNLNPLSGGALGNVVDMKNVVNDKIGVNSNKQPKPPQTGAEIITRLLGGFPSRDNPALDDYYQQKDQQQHVKDQISYMRKQGQQIPKQMNQQAYKKIPFPITGQ